MVMISQTGKPPPLSWSWASAFVSPVPLYSPFVAAIIAFTPACTPSPYFPFWKAGVISCVMISLQVASGSAPSSPRPVQMNIFRSLTKMKRIAPLSFPFCPGCHAL